MATDGASAAVERVRRRLVRRVACGEVLAVRRTGVVALFPLVALACFAFMVLVRDSEDSKNRTLQELTASQANQRTPDKGGSPAHSKEVHWDHLDHLADENIGPRPMVVHN